MMEIRRADERGRADFGWLDSRHTFSFGHYHDPRFMGFGPLRVINEDRVTGGQGFDSHGHRDMEIISYVLEGALAHKDSIGTGSAIRPGDVQRMSAGTGIMHSEFNASEDRPVHFLQIWIIPEARGIAPSYEQKHFAPEARRGKITLVAGKGGRDGALTIHQDADLYSAILASGDEVSHEVKPGRKIWVQIAEGAVTLNGTALKQGDGAALADESHITLKADAASDVLIFDMA